MKKNFMETSEYLTANKARLELNVAIVNDKASEIAKNKKVMDDAIKALNEKIIEDEYAELLKAENPVLTAITQVRIDVCGTKIDKTSKEYDFIDKMYIIDLLELDSKCKDKVIFNNCQWKYWAEALNHAVFNTKMTDYEITKKSDRLDKFKISTVAESLELPNLDTIASQTKAIQMILDAILFTAYVNKKGEQNDKLNAYKVETRHTKLLLDTFSNWSNKTATAVTFHTDKTFRQSLMRVFHSVVTKEMFTAE